MVLIRVPDPVDRITVLNTCDCYAKFIFHRDSTLHYTNKSNLYFFQVPSICSSKKLRYFTKFRFIRNFANFLIFIEINISFFFSDTVRCISSNVEIVLNLMDDRTFVSINSREMIFHAQEFNNFEGENNLFIMDVISQDSNGDRIYSMPLRFRTNS